MMPKSNFTKFIDKTPSFGKTFLCIDDKNVKQVITKTKSKNFYTYGFSKGANFQITNPKQYRNFSVFNLKISIPGIKNEIKNIKIPLIGFHNIKNSASCAAISFLIGINSKIIKSGLRFFKGVERRFNFLFERNIITINQNLLPYFKKEVEKYFFSLSM